MDWQAEEKQRCRLRVRQRGAETPAILPGFAKLWFQLRKPIGKAQRCFSLLRKTRLKAHAASHLRYEVVAYIGLGTTEDLKPGSNTKTRGAGPIR